MTNNNKRVLATLLQTFLLLVYQIVTKDPTFSADPPRKMSVCHTKHACSNREWFDRIMGKSREDGGGGGRKKQ